MTGTFTLECPNCESLDTYYSADKQAWLCQQCNMNFQWFTGLYNPDGSLYDPASQALIPEVEDEENEDWEEEDEDI